MTPSFFQRFRGSKIAFILLQLCVLLLVGIALFIAVFIGLGHYTHHGEGEEVPDLRGLYLEEAEIVLQAQQLSYTVIDSMYNSRFPLGVILEQNPSAGSIVKHGRHIYLITNTRQVKRVLLPELHDISLRQAQSILSSMRIEILDVIYEPSEYKNLVLDIRRNGESILAGTPLEEGSGVVLVVGEGTGDEQVIVPSLIGLSQEEARSLLLGASLTMAGVYVDNSDGNGGKTPVVYSQEPEEGELILAGTGVSIWLSTDAQKSITNGVKHNDDEDFF